MFIYSGGEESRHGVGILLNSKVSKNLKGYWKINERLVMCKIEAKPFNITIIQCYAPTTDHPEKEVEEFYSQIKEAFKTNKFSRHGYHTRGLPCQSGKNSNIHKYRKIWPWENK